MATEKEFLNIKEAAEYLGINRATVWRLVKSYNLTTYISPVSKRDRLLKKADLDELKQPKPVGGQTKRDVA